MNCYITHAEEIVRRFDRPGWGAFGQEAERQANDAALLFSFA